MVWAMDGSATWMGWNRRSSAASFSRCLRYSSSVVAPMVCSSPRASLGLRMLAASGAPSGAPGPAVLGARGGAGGLQLTAGQHRLEDAGGVDRALGGTGPDERVDLVDEQDDVAAGADLLEHLLEALLEVTAVARPGDEGAEVEGVELLVLQRLGHLALDDGLGQALDDGGLADAGLADEDGVVLGAPREDLHDPLDLLGAPDDRVELGVARGLRGGAAARGEGQRRRRGALGRAARRGWLLALVAGEQLDDLLAAAGGGGAR